MFFPALHSLRGLAALWVLLYHVWVYTIIGSAGASTTLARWLNPLLSVGWLGVHLFFVLSGFLLTLGWLHRPRGVLTYRAYMTRRASRILPAYYVQLIVLSIMGGFALGPWELLAHLGLWLNLPPSYISPMNGVWWTLPIEFGFYLMLPALARCLLHFGPFRFFLGILALTFTYRIMVFQALQGSAPELISNRIDQLPGTLTLFAAGMVAAWYAQRDMLWLQAVRWRIFLCCLAIAWVAVLLVNLNDYWDGNWALVTWGSVNGVIYAAIVLSVYRLGAKMSWLARSVSVWLGQVSYGIYLWHLPVLLWIQPWLPEALEGWARFTVLLLLVLAATLVLAGLSWRLVERPAIAWARRLTAAKA